MTIDVTRLRSHVSELLLDYGVPSAAIGVLQHGEIIDFAVGCSNVATGTPATTDTIYQCGSMTKTWTAVAFMQLVDEGKVGLDEPVRTFLPGFRVADPEVSVKVTPRHLLHHTNGIEEDFGDPGEDDDVYERMVENIADAPQVHPLGRTHGYSAALGYAVLARIMEVVDSTRWDNLMKDRLFDPLGLTSTTSRRAQVDRDRAATGHLIRSLDEGPIISPLDYLPRCYGPGGNINSTVGEVLALAHLFLDGGRAQDGTQVLSTGSLREMMQSRVALPDPYLFGPAWALGLIVCDWRGETVYASDGSTIGQNSRLRILPDSNLAIAMLTNGGPRESLYKRVFNEILTDLDAGTIPDLPTQDPSLRLDLSRYEGVYQRPGTRYEVDAEGENLYLTMNIDPLQAQFLGKPDRIRYPLLPVSETHFVMPSADPLEDTQTVAIYDFTDGDARYLHTNCRVHPRV
jgi:CubicO group peptidase (beta-lactamase class C family)